MASSNDDDVLVAQVSSLAQQTVYSFCTRTHTSKVAPVHILRPNEHEISRRVVEVLKVCHSSGAIRNSNGLRPAANTESEADCILPHASDKRTLGDVAEQEQRAQLVASDVLISTQQNVLLEQLQIRNFLHSSLPPAY